MCSLSGVMTLIPACWAKAAHEIIVSAAINGPRKTFLLVDAAIMSSRGQSRARKIWIDDTLGGATRCRRVALRQRRVAAFVIAGPAAVHVQANRISWIVRLGRRWHYWDRLDHQNRQGQNAHQILLGNMRGAA